MEPVPVMDRAGFYEGRRQGNTWRVVLMGLGLVGVIGVLGGCSSVDAKPVAETVCAEGVQCNSPNSDEEEEGEGLRGENDDEAGGKEFEDRLCREEGLCG